MLILFLLLISEILFIRPTVCYFETVAQMIGLLDCCLSNGFSHNVNYYVLPDACKLATVLTFFFFCIYKQYTVCKHYAVA